MSGRTKPVVMILIHGIRTHADWHAKMPVWLEADENLVIKSIGYGYFDAFRFWFPFFTRNWPLKKVEEELEFILQEYPHQEWDRIILAHSFGTYTISKILKRKPAWRFSDIVLCGCIISNRFQWASISNQIDPEGHILNECGSKDIWPVLAKSLSWGYGSTGTYGLRSGSAEDRFHPIGHSEFFDKEFAKKFWKPFIKNRKVVQYKNIDNIIKNPKWFNIFEFPFKWLLVASVLFSGLSVSGVVQSSDFNQITNLKYLFSNCRNIPAREYEKCLMFKSRFGL